MDLLKDQHVLILGLGVSGLAMARWCVRHGARVTVADTREAPPQLASLRSELPMVKFVSGAFDAALVSADWPSQGAKAPPGGSAAHEVASVGANMSADWPSQGSDIHAVFKSPGLTPAAVAPLWSAAQARGLWTGGELSLFAQGLADLKQSRGYEPKVLAVTGTNGKTTVTSLTGQLVERAGKTVAVAGNIGPTLLDTLAQRLDAGTLPEVWVIELSSFQLDGVKDFEPTAAAVLNLTQDHLDWHGSMSAAGPSQGAKAPQGGSAAHEVASVGTAMQAYAAAKARIFGETGLMILNREDPLVMAMLPLPLKGRQDRSGVTFGSDMPQRPGDFGIEEVNGMVWLVRALEADETRRKRKGEAEEELHIQRLMPADALRIRGRHNAVNALAALALAAAAGCPLAPVLYGLREYRGEPHRVESIAVINDVEFFDDSKGTNVGAAVAALNGLGADRKLVAILGGEGKGQDFSPLAAPVSRHARAVVLIGRDAPLIRAALEPTGVPLVAAESMEQAVAQANRLAHAGDAVLMSPACASFDMFDNYEHRARVFCDAVHELAQNAGAQSGGAT